jgi:hypothetical protein
LDVDALYCGVRRLVRLSAEDKKLQPCTVDVQRSVSGIAQLVEDVHGQEPCGSGQSRIEINGYHQVEHDSSNARFVEDIAR